MTMRTSGRLPADATAAGGDARRSARRRFMGLSDDALKRKRAWLQIAGNAQALERVLGLVVHGAAGALGNFGAVELEDDLVDRARLRGHRRRDVGIAERAVALAVAGEIERNDRDALAPRIGPDIGLGPMQDRMDAQMRAGRRRGVEMIPEFRRLIAHVPAALDAARREHPFLGAGRLLVAANAGEQAVEAVFGERELEALGLARR